MTPERIKIISGNFIGRLTTDREVREQLDAVDPKAVDAHAKYAAIINAATDARPRVKAADIPAIVKEIRARARGYRRVSRVAVAQNLFVFLSAETD